MQQPQAEPLTAPPVDLFIVCDTTGSMRSYVASLKSTFPQIIAVMKLLFQDRVNVHLVSYTDYCYSKDSLVTYCSQRTHSDEELANFIAKLAPIGGRDYPEAIKTALNFTLHKIDELRHSEASNALVMIYTDAPPHHVATGSRHEKQERGAIADNQNYRAGYDWIGICNAYREANVPVYTFHSVGYVFNKSMFFYNLLGPVFPLRELSTNNITRATIGVLMHLMNVPFEHDNLYFVGKSKFDGQYIVDNIYETENEFPLLDKQLLKLVDTEFAPFVVDALDFMVEDLHVLPNRFKNEPEYQDLVYKILREMFVPENVLALTYNPILGKLWRLCSSRRLDPRLEELTTKLSACVPSLQGQNKEMLQKWIADSYNQTEFIQETIDGIDGPFLVLEAGAPQIDVEDLRSLSRAPNPGAIRSVQAILTHIKLVNVAPAEDSGTNYLPLSLDGKFLFSFLPHLVQEGMAFSTKGAAVVALICCLSEHAILKDRSSAYLKSIQGKWIPLDNATDIPECLSLEFIKLMYRGREYLTTHEQFVYTQLRMISRMRLAASLPVDLTVGYIPQKTELLPDYMVKCSSCGFDTSLTLMATQTECGLCVSFGMEEAKAIRQQYATEEKKSHLVECRGCHGIYAVVRTDLLNIEPKCHFCRENENNPPPTVECTRCLNKFVDPAGFIQDMASKSPSWKCAVCEHAPASAFATKTVSLHKLLELYPSWATLFEVSNNSQAYVSTIMNNQLNYFKLFTQHNEIIFPAEGSAPPDTCTKNIEIGKKKVHNVDALMQWLSNEVLRGSLKEACNLCFEDCTLPSLESSCGQCSTKVCSTCLDAWYGESKPGCLLLLTHLCCPFCRRYPKTATLKRHNKQACALIRSQPISELRGDMYYGWCRSCYNVREMMAHDCAQQLPRGVTDFQCAECAECAEKARVDEPMVTTICPNCEVLTEKIDGCNHITCDCGQHWCYECGKGFDSADTTYSHLYEVHGGVY